jgi:hypothetical protein
MLHADDISPAIGMTIQDDVAVRIDAGGFFYA